MFYVYIIKSIYIGQTKDLEDRLNRHNSGRERYTKNKGFFEIIYKERAEAMQRERVLKGGKGREWIKNNFL